MDGRLWLTNFTKASFPTKAAVELLMSKMPRRVAEL